MTTNGLDIAFFGSSILSSWWNGACTYYRGIVRGLAACGHRVTFYEPDAYDRQAHRDIDEPEWARVVVYEAQSEPQVRAVVETARGVDVAIKTSGVGVFDEVLESAVLGLAGPATATAFWDVDAPATLARIEADRSDAMRALLPYYDVVLSYGGGAPVQRRYRALGARDCVLVYNALDPETHHPSEPDARFAADLSLLANRLPDREARVDEFFFRAATLLPNKHFLLAGSGWDDKPMPPNVRWIGHLGPNEHNAFNCSAVAVLNVTRESMTANGWSPATRVFEAAGAGSCLVTDAWEGIEDFLEPGREVLVARDGADVARVVDGLCPSRAKSIGAAAHQRVLRDHTYDRRARQVHEVLCALTGARR